MPLPQCRAWDLNSSGDVEDSPSSTHPLPHLTPKSGWAVQPCSMTGKVAFCATIPPLWSLKHPCQVFGTSPRSICPSAPQAQSKLGRVQNAVPPTNTAVPQKDPVPGIAEGEPPSGHPQVTPRVSLPPAWQGPSALPEPVAIKGPGMEELGGGAGLLLETEWDLPVCPRRSGSPGSGNGRLDGGEQPEQHGMGSGGWGTPCSPPPPPASPGGTFGAWPGICIASHEGFGGIKLPFHRHLSCGAVGAGGEGHSAGSPAASPQTMAALCWGFTRPAPFPAAQLVTFYHLHILMGIQRAQMHRETTKRSLPPSLLPLPCASASPGKQSWDAQRGCSHWEPSFGAISRVTCRPLGAPSIFVPFPCHQPSIPL